jgi:hypothetical protein
MHNSDTQETSTVEFRRRQRWRWFLVTIVALTLFVGLWRARRTGHKTDEPMPSVERARQPGQWRFNGWSRPQAKPAIREPMQGPG